MHQADKFEILKRTGAMGGVLIILIILAAPQFVGIIFFLPAALVGFVVGYLFQNYHDTWHWEGLSYLTAAGGAVVAGLGVMFLNKASELWTGVAIIVVFAVIIPAGIALGYYGLTGKKPGIMKGILKSKSRDLDGNKNS